MVFSSAEFLFIFLPLFLIAYVLGHRFRNVALLLFSLLFYYVGEGYFLMVMLVSITANYTAGLFLGSKSENARKVALWLGLSAGLLMLVYYKYIGFLFYDVFQLPENEVISNVHLPIGISFYTFQCMSYLIDVYRGDAKSEKSILRLATYIAMFPQLIAGPIVRFSTVARGLKRRHVRPRHIYFGFIFFCVGLAEKVLLADTVAEIADQIYAQIPADLNASAALLGGIAYFFQIFFDFSGYSAMAIGLGLILGFKFPRNFNFPYISQSITEFWRRWHISLSSWFRDYVYIPLGGNRLGVQKTYRNLVAIFLLTGIWHGASWNFVIWGLWHGLFMLIERAGFSSVLKKCWIGLRIIYMLLVVYIGWILFRANDLRHALELMGQLFDFDSSILSAWLFLDNEKMLILAASVIFCTPLVMTLSKTFLAPPEYGAWNKKAIPTRKYAVGCAVCVILLALSSLKILSGAYSPFIYFRF
mgnify:CR=1 FL=1